MFSAQFAINNYLLYILRDYVGEPACPATTRAARPGSSARVRRWRR